MTHLLFPSICLPREGDAVEGSAGLSRGVGVYRRAPGQLLDAAHPPPGPASLPHLHAPRPAQRRE